MRWKADDTGTEPPGVFRSDHDDQILLNLQGGELEGEEGVDRVRAAQPWRDQFGRLRGRPGSFGQGDGYNLACVGEEPFLFGQILRAQIIFDEQRSVTKSPCSHG